MYQGKLISNAWDSSIRKPEQFETLINKHDELNKCIFDTGHIKINCISLSIAGEEILINLEKTICKECNSMNNWCAIPEYTLGNDLYDQFVSKLKRIPCQYCYTPMIHRGVIWRES